MAFSPSGSSKRTRTAVNNGIQAATCLVDGCTADLSNCRKYHQRHKVCEVHSKTPQVSIDGQKLRFCQQCSRFHSLEEFDEGKRSCRKRLDGHNRRRRKPQPYLFSNPYGANVLQFVGPHVHPTTALANPRSTVDVKASSSNDKLFSEEYAPPVRLDYSDSAPSLLSSSPSQTPCTTLSHVMHTPSISFSTAARPLDPGLSHGGLENDSDAGWGGNGMVDMGPHQHAPCDHEDPQKLPFYWR